MVSYSTLITRGWIGRQENPSTTYGNYCEEMFVETQLFVSLKPWQIHSPMHFAFAIIVTLESNQMFVELTMVPAIQKKPVHWSTLPKM